MNLILFGPPGSGKGTQSKKLADKYRLMHISTGDILRNEIAQKSPLGVQVKGIIERGELVSDKILIEILHSVIQKNQQVSGFIFDGFPRTIPQAEALDQMMEKDGQTIERVISLEVDDAELLRRLLNRAIESGRTDDTAEVIRKRLEVYHEHTSPLLDYYNHKGLLKRIHGIGSVDTVFSSICDIL
jgi:adenylate kinase